jgi:hypothetical protein
MPPPSPPTAARRRHQRAAIQKNGNAQKKRGGPSPLPKAANARVARTTVPCVCTTPFGSALDPDV